MLGVRNIVLLGKDLAERRDQFCIPSVVVDGRRSPGSADVSRYFVEFSSDLCSQLVT